MFDFFGKRSLLLVTLVLGQFGCSHTVNDPDPLPEGHTKLVENVYDEYRGEKRVRREEVTRRRLSREHIVIE